MDYFMNQGRCRVCGQMFCCSRHQREHERVQHDEYADWLDIFPILCRTCHRTIHNIPEMKARCFQFNSNKTFLKHSINLPTFNSTPTRANRKRAGFTQDKNERNSKKISAVVNVTPVEYRKKLIASHRRKKVESAAPSVILVDLNDIKITDNLINSVFSPQFNISYKILATDVKSSTPLYDDKENLSVIAVFEKNEISNYVTPEIVQNSSFVVISAMKKNSTPREGIMKTNNSKTKKTNSRKVTFEEDKTSEIDDLDRSVYGTPQLKLETAQESPKFEQVQELTITFEKIKSETSQVEISIYGTLEAENVNTDEEIKSEQNKGSQHCTIVNLVKLTFYGIPRYIFKAYDWSSRVIRKRKSSEISSPVKSEPDYSQQLKRRPLFSNWVNRSASSLIRKPLAMYNEG